jgi:hypothetical protein
MPRNSFYVILKKNDKKGFSGNVTHRPGFEFLALTSKKHIRPLLKLIRIKKLTDEENPY